MDAHDIPEPWLLRHLVLRTPRLELRPDDAGLHELVDVVYGGVHPTDEMPFRLEWTDADPRDFGSETFQYFWRERASVTRGHWAIHFLVRRDGRVIGTQGLMATDFGMLREVTSGSWLGRAHQGQGVRTEMRAPIPAAGATLTRHTLTGWRRCTGSSRLLATLPRPPD